jgi:type IV pilus assembly protein PilA
MKKTNNGFSLVELIIVIAIMAILAGAIAPALIKYIDKSRKSNDVSSAKTIKTAVETALGTESVYETLVNDKGSYINITPNSATATSSALSEDATAAKNIAIGIAGTDLQHKTDSDGKSGAKVEACATLIGANIGETTPKIKYKKDTDSITPNMWVVTINAKGTVTVGLAKEAVKTNELVDGTGYIELAPDINENYQ